MSDDTFLRRWSRLKTKSRKAAPAAPPAEEPAPQPPAVVEQKPPEEKAAPELPPIEELTAESDYSAFLRPGVPEETKLAALRKLWTSDPTLAAPDPLDLHNFDYSFPAVPEVVKTAYQVGKGFIDALEEATDEKAGEKKADAPPPETT
jgi:hypothetical protein